MVVFYFYIIHLYLGQQGLITHTLLKKPSLFQCFHISFSVWVQVTIKVFCSHSLLHSVLPPHLLVSLVSSLHVTLWAYTHTHTHFFIYNIHTKICKIGWTLYKREHVFFSEIVRSHLTAYTLSSARSCAMKEDLKLINSTMDCFIFWW